MTQTLLPPVPPPGPVPSRGPDRTGGPDRAGGPDRLRPAPSRTGLSLHGTDGADGLPVTWHVTSLADDGAPGTYLVERAEGDINSPAVWMQAQRQAATVGEAEVLELVRAVLFRDR